MLLIAHDQDFKQHAIRLEEIYTDSKVDWGLVLEGRQPSPD